MTDYLTLEQLEDRIAAAEHDLFTADTDIARKVARARIDLLRAIERSALYDEARALRELRAWRAGLDHVEDHSKDATR